MLPTGIPRPPFLLIFFLSAVSGLITGYQTLHLLEDMALRNGLHLQVPPALLNSGIMAVAFIAGMLLASLIAIAAITASIGTAYWLRHRRSARQQAGQEEREDK